MSGSAAQHLLLPPPCRPSLPRQAVCELTQRTCSFRFCWGATPQVQKNSKTLGPEIFKIPQVTIPQAPPSFQGAGAPSPNKKAPPALRSLLLLPAACARARALGSPGCCAFDEQHVVEGQHPSLRFQGGRSPRRPSVWASHSVDGCLCDTFSGTSRRQSTGLPNRLAAERAWRDPQLRTARQPASAVQGKGRRRTQR